MSTAAQLAQAIENDDTAARLADACGVDPSRICTWVFDQTNNGFLAAATEWVVERPMKVVLIALGAYIISRLARRGVRLAAKRIVATTTSARLAGIRAQGPMKILADAEENKRAQARAATISSVLSSVITALVWSVAALMMLGVFDINIGPLLAGAGIAGIAIGFGCQTVVKDFMSGLFMLIEDQFGVGDVIDVGPVTGTVEAVSLRTTTIRDVSGTVWHVPNGEVARIGNYSQLWSRALLDIEVAYETDLRFAEGVIQRVANEMWDDPEWGGDELMEAPEVWGIQSLGASGIAIRLVVKTEPSVQWKVERELRLRIKEAFDEAGIEIPFPQRTLWLRDQGRHQLGEAPDPSTIKTVEPPRHREVVSDAEGLRPHLPGGSRPGPVGAVAVVGSVWRNRSAGRPPHPDLALPGPVGAPVAVVGSVWRNRSAGRPPAPLPRLLVCSGGVPAGATRRPEWLPRSGSRRRRRC